MKRNSRQTRRVRVPLVSRVWMPIATGFLMPLGALAQTNNPGPGLAGIPASSYANDVERSAAIANQDVFDRLDPLCNPGGVFDVQPEPEYDAMLVAPSCTESVFFVYTTSRELVHSANEILGQGSIAGSLGVDLTGLGLALRWTAAEEFAAQSSMATEFSNSQSSSLAARMSALRFGATGFGVVGAYHMQSRSMPLLAQLGGAEQSEDSGDGQEFSPWGGFLNGSFGYGDKDPTPLEDAFDFDGSEVTLGIDYRFDNNVVFGAIIGFTEQTIDFDESASDVSVVDGGMQADGESLIFFGLSQGERLSISGALGVQSLDYDVERNIKYASFNPDTESANSIALSQPESDLTIASFNVGFAFSPGRFTAEPYFNIDYLDVTIDSFAEQRSINRLGSGESRRFDLVISEQNFESLDVSLGVRMQYVFTPEIGVIIPYWQLAAHREMEDDQRIVSAGYSALVDVLGDDLFSFEVATDAPDETFATASVGFSTVFRGRRPRGLGGPIRGGLMGFLQYSTVSGLDHYEDQVIVGGLRYEF